MTKPSVVTATRRQCGVFGAIRTLFLNDGIISLDLGVPCSGGKVVVVEPNISEGAHGEVMIVVEVILVVIDDGILLGIVIGVDAADEDALNIVNGGEGTIVGVGEERGGWEGRGVVVGGGELRLVFNPDSERFGFHMLQPVK